MVCDQEPKARGMFRSVDSGNSLTTQSLVDRIIRHRQTFIERNELKERKELQMFEMLKREANGQQQT